jgi:hypothetical protein
MNKSPSERVIMTSKFQMTEPSYQQSMDNTSMTTEFERMSETPYIVGVNISEKVLAFREKAKLR